MSFKDNRIASPQLAYDLLRKQIISMEREPGSPLGEQKLATELNVSRTPVREGLVRLSSEGLVDLIPNKGAIVAPISAEAVRAAQFIRESLEISLALEASRKISAIGKLKLKQAIEEQKLAEQEGADRLFYKSDEKMHRAIAVIAGLPIVWRQIEDAKVQMDRVRRLNLRHADSFKELIAQHERIVTAICEADEDLIVTSLRQHLRMVLPDLEELKNSRPNFFSSEIEADSELELT